MLAVCKHTSKLDNKLPREVGGWTNVPACRAAIGILKKRSTARPQGEKRQFAPVFELESGSLPLKLSDIIGLETRRQPKIL